MHGSTIQDGHNKTILKVGVGWGGLQYLFR